MMNDAPVFTGREYETQLIGYALQEGLAQEFEELNTCLLTPEEEEMLQMAEKHMHKHLKLIDRTLRRRDRCTNGSSLALVLMKYAAACILLASLSFGTALAVSPKLRTEVVEYLTYVTAPYVEVGADEDQDTLQPPKGWMGDYFPTHMPEGYNVYNIDTHSQYSQIVYMNTGRDMIICSVYTTPTNIQANAENALCYTVTTNAENAYLYVMDSYSIVTWTNNNLYYTFSAAATDTVLDLFDSLTSTDSNNLPVL